MYVVTADEMQRADAITTDKYKISSAVLMERAALCVVKEVKDHNPKKVLVIAGSGHNGGDGIAIARQLIEETMQVNYVDLYMTAPIEHCKGLTYEQLLSYQAYGGKMVESLDDVEYDIIIDAILGIGKVGKLRNEVAEVIEKMNQMHKRGAYVIAVDIPSGVNADTGAVEEIAVMADRTVTFGFFKRGHFMYPGAYYCGRVDVASIGITEKALKDTAPSDTFTFHGINEVDLPLRDKDGNKGTFGNVLVIAGSKEICGACFLAAYAAYRSGAGLVHIVTNDLNRETLSKQLPEAVLHTYSDVDDEICNMLSQLTKKAKSIVLGPGIGQSEDALRLVKTVLDSAEVPIVVDADAINIIGSNREKLTKIMNQNPLRELIFTPHPLELSRLSGESIEVLKSDYVSNIRRIASENHIILVGKGAGSVVSDGVRAYINCSGNDGMATGGSGDVLAGIIAGFIAQGAKAFDGAVVGTYIHGCCGDEAALRLGNKYSLMAHELADVLPEVITRNIKNRRLYNGVTEETV